MNITDERLYPLFPHSGQPGQTVVFNGQSLAPVDMSIATQRLASTGNDLLFSYQDINGGNVVLRLDIPHKRWFVHKYAEAIGTFYLEEGDASSHWMSLPAAPA